MINQWWETWLWQTFLETLIGFSTGTKSQMSTGYLLQFSSGTFSHFSTGCWTGTWNTQWRERQKCCHSAPWAPCCNGRPASWLEPRCSSSEGSSHTSSCSRAQSKAPCNLSHTPPRTTSRIQPYIPPRRKSHTRMNTIVSLNCTSNKLITFSS